MKLMKAQEWPSSEISTRNCIHCVAPMQGIHISCGKGHKLLRSYTYNGVVTTPIICKGCEDCPDFDNRWE